MKSRVSKNPSSGRVVGIWSKDFEQSDVRLRNSSLVESMGVVEGRNKG